jgi:hypothetical protein
MPTASEILRMRQTAQKRLPDAAKIERNISGALQTVAENVPCRLLSSREADTANPLLVRSEVKIVLPALTDVKTGDQITINNQLFTVAAPVVAKSDEITRTVEGNNL